MYNVYDILNGLMFNLAMSAQKCIAVKLLKLLNLYIRQCINVHITIHTNINTRGKSWRI